MNVYKYLELMKKYGNCPDCGNEFLGNGEGTLNVEDTTFERTCKCGFAIKVDEDGKVLK